MPASGRARPSERRKGASRTASQERAKRSARRPSGVAWVPSVATAAGITISRSGQSMSPSAAPPSQLAPSAPIAASAAPSRPPTPKPAIRGERGDAELDRRRTGAERDDREQRADGVGEPAQRHPAGDRQRAALDLVDAPLRAEDALVGADRLEALAHGKIRCPIAAPASAT